MTDAMQDTTQFTYDFADLVGITDPLLNTTSFFNDGAGRLVQRTDPLGNTTKYQYNNLNQLTQITDALQGVTTLTYDFNGNLHTVLDARQQGTNNYTLYSYDNFDHLQTRKDPLQRREGYVFDQLGNLTSFTDRRGKVSNYLYDGIDRRTFAGYGFVSPNYESTVNYTYDGGNRLSKVVDTTSGTITPVFDGLDRLLTETTSQGVVNYTYDNDSRLQTATVTGQPTVTYYYDNASRLYQVTQGSTNTFIGYDNANRRNSLTLPNGILLTYGYDNDSRISGMTYTLGTTTAVGSLTYQYDAAGRRTQMGGSLAATGFPQAMTLAAYDVANELTNWNGTTITPDANGNILNDGVAAYTWNGRNQLISRGSTSFEYDTFGRRILNAAGNNLLYEGWNAGQELSGTTPIANRVLGGIDEFFNRTDSTGPYSPITDALGSALALTNSSGNITAQYGYDAFGNTTLSGGTSTNVFQYTGRENDGTGLYSYRARYYSPTFGRFISEDPIGLRGGFNFYRYANDSPANYTDPYGLDVTIVQYEGAGGFGHVGIGVNNNPTQGFYPNDVDVPLPGGVSFDLYYLAPIAAPGIVKPDNPGEQIGVPIVIPATPDQDAAIQRYIDSRVADPGLYNLFGRNCVDFVIKALAAGGISENSTMFPHRFIRTLNRQANAPSGPYWPDYPQF
jgi:RHS repeat-associated protein